MSQVATPKPFPAAETKFANAYTCRRSVTNGDRYIEYDQVIQVIDGYRSSHIVLGVMIDGFQVQADETDVEAVLDAE